MVVEGNTQIQRMFLNNGYDVMLDDDLTKIPDLVCFGGGSDISPNLYGEKPHARCGHVNASRDFKEQAYFEQFIDTPKVGICRGGQLLNVLSGGKMWQHVNNHDLRDGHEVVDLLLSKKMIHVTSTHHQMMLPSKAADVIAVAFCSSEFLTMASPPHESPEYDAEVCWYSHTQSLCYQPHPEHWMPRDGNAENEDYFFDLIDYFFN